MAVVFASNGRDLKDFAIAKVYKGHANPLDEIRTYGATPNAAVTADFTGQLCYDYANEDWYINTYTSATTWVKLID